MKKAEYGYAIYNKDGEWVTHVNTWEQVQRILQANNGYDYEILDKDSYEELYINKNRCVK